MNDIFTAKFDFFYDKKIRSMLQLLHMFKHDVIFMMTVQNVSVSSKIETIVAGPAGEM